MGLPSETGTYRAHFRFAIGAVSDALAKLSPRVRFHRIEAFRHGRLDIRCDSGPPNRVVFDLNRSKTDVPRSSRGGSK